MTVTTNMYAHVANRIQKFIYNISKGARLRKRKEQSPSTDVLKNDILTVNIPILSFREKISWEATERSIGLKAAVENRRPESASLPALGQQDSVQQEERCRENRSQDTKELKPIILTLGSLKETDATKSAIPLSTFTCFNQLPFELRLQIWHLTIEPGLVHWNIVGAQRSGLKVDRRLPVISQVCRESRAEGLQIFNINPQATLPFFFNVKADTLLRTRYPNCPRTVDQDAVRLFRYPLLKRVRHLAILLRYWNRLLTGEGTKELYTAIRRAKKLEVITLVDDYFMRRHGESQLTQGRMMKLVDMSSGGDEVRTVRREKHLRAVGIEKLWKQWDVNLISREGVTYRKFPEVRFARSVIEFP